MHDTPDGAHWHEPQAGENAGFGKFKRQPLPYDRFMEAEGVPCYRGIGVRRVQDLPLVTWSRLGGRGTRFVPARLSASRDFYCKLNFEIPWPVPPNWALAPVPVWG
jgi:hypothetical protein